MIGVNEVPSDNIVPKMDLWGKGPLIGWQSFSNAANELWIDDLVLAPSRVGCQ